MRVKRGTEGGTCRTGDDTQGTPLPPGMHSQLALGLAKQVLTRNSLGRNAQVAEMFQDLIWN